jgi:hypothetical protein
MTVKGHIFIHPICTTPLATYQDYGGKRGGANWVEEYVSLHFHLAALLGKVGEKSQSETMKEKFHTFRGKRGLDVANINDSSVWFAT